MGEASDAVRGDICDATDILSSDCPESENEICGWSASELAEWANAFQVKHNAVDNLLKRLKRHGYQDLPSTARTLIKTLRNIQIDTKSDMEYYYFRVKEEIVKHSAKYPDALKTKVSQIFISLNIDGLQIKHYGHKSGTHGDISSCSGIWILLFWIFSWTL